MDIEKLMQRLALAGELLLGGKAAAQEPPVSASEPIAAVEAALPPVPTVELTPPGLLAGKDFTEQFRLLPEVEASFELKEDPELQVHTAVRQQLREDALTAHLKEPEIKVEIPVPDTSADTTLQYIKDIIGDVARSSVLCLPVRGGAQLRLSGTFDENGLPSLTPSPTPADKPRTDDPSPSR